MNKTLSAYRERELCNIYMVFRVTALRRGVMLLYGLMAVPLDQLSHECYRSVLGCDQTASAALYAVLFEASSKEWRP